VKLNRMGTRGAAAGGAAGRELATGMQAGKGGKGQ
jgi:hypothetical protein